MGTSPNTTTNYTYDYRERLTNEKTGPSSPYTADQNFTLTYDDASNVKTTTDGTINEVATYGYDPVNRLTSMTLTLNGNAEPGASYTYDQGGRMLQKTEGSSSETMQYGFLAPEHAVWSLAAGGHDDILHYDANGNVCSYWADGSDFTCNPPAGNTTYAYDAENRITSRIDAAGGNDTYTYDAQGTLVVRTQHDGSYTVYIGGIYEEDHAAGGTVVGVRKYYQMNGRTVAVRNAADASGTQTGTLDFLLLDHLGSVVGLLGTSGNVEPGTATTYWPYGAVRTGGLDSSAESDRQFTGQQMQSGDPALGLYNYNARFYSTTLGAFVSADTVGDGLNRYAYVHDNPLTFVDPTGHCFNFFGFFGSASSECNSNIAARTVRCAMFLDGCTGNLQHLASIAVGQQQFWTNVGSIAGEQLSGFKMNDLGREIVVSYFDASRDGNVFGMSNVGWSKVGAWFGSSGEYFRAVLSEFAFGTNDIGNVPYEDMVGAQQLWTDPAFQSALVAGGEGGRVGHVNQDWSDATLAAARYYAGQGTPSDKVEWDRHQAIELATRAPALDVDPAHHEGNPYADCGGDCVVGKLKGPNGETLPDSPIYSPTEPGEEGE